MKDLLTSALRDEKSSSGIKRNRELINSDEDRRDGTVNIPRQSNVFNANNIYYRSKNEQNKNKYMTSTTAKITESANIGNKYLSVNNNQQPLNARHKSATSSSSSISSFVHSNGSTSTGLKGLQHSSGMNIIGGVLMNSNRMLANAAIKPVVNSHTTNQTTNKSTNGITNIMPWIKPIVRPTKPPEAQLLKVSAAKELKVKAGLYYTHIHTYPCTLCLLSMTLYSSTSDINALLSRQSSHADEAEDEWFDSYKSRMAKLAHKENFLQAESLIESVNTRAYHCTECQTLTEQPRSVCINARHRLESRTVTKRFFECGACHRRGGYTIDAPRLAVPHYSCSCGSKEWVPCGKRSLGPTESLTPAMVLTASEGSKRRDIDRLKRMASGL